MEGLYPRYWATARSDARGALHEPPVQASPQPMQVGQSWASTQRGRGVTGGLVQAPAIDRVVRSEYREQRTMGADNVLELKAFRPAN